MDEQTLALKELIETKLDLLHNKIDHNHEYQKNISNNILQQATKTNSRVDKIEDEIKEINDYEHRGLSCPYKDEIKVINEKIIVLDEDVTLLKFLKRYPKFSVFIFSASVISVLILVFNFIKNI